MQELKDILALPLEDRDRALINMLKPLLEPLHPEPEYLFDLLDWLLLTESHDNEFIFKLLTEPSDAAKKVLKCSNGDSLRSCASVMRPPPTAAVGERYENSSMFG